MHSNQKFGIAAHCNRDRYWQSIRSLDSAPAGVFATARRALGEATTRVLSHFAVGHLSASVEAATALEIRLPAHGLWSGYVEAGTAILCREGTLWVTRTGDPHDHILRAGQALHISWRTQVVVTTLSDGADVGIRPAVSSA